MALPITSAAAAQPEARNAGALLAATGSPTGEALAARHSLARQEAAQVNREYAERWQALSARLHRAEDSAEETRSASAFVAASARLRLYHRFFEEVRAVARPVLLGLAVLVLLAGLAVTLGKSLRLPGFRPGKVPMQILRRRFGRSVLGEVVENAVQGSSAEAIREHNLRPALPPIRQAGASTPART